MGQVAPEGLVVYLAGPLFTQSERLWNRRLAESLTDGLGCEVILPQDFGTSGQFDSAEHFAEVFRLCVDGVDACDVVVAVLDGADVDSGTAFEVGYAYARGKPIIGVRTDFRPQQERGTNLMLSRPCDAFVECSSLRGDLAALSATICREIRALAKHTAQRGNAAGEIA